jgi:hypothetical protein
MQGKTCLVTRCHRGHRRGYRAGACPSQSPDAAGIVDVVITVTLERSVRRLDEGRLSWGREHVLEVGKETVGSATQRLRIMVAP